MKCEFCGFDSDRIIILNIASEKNIGSLNTFACLDCAEKSEAYCLRHEMPHLSFFDATTACRLCIEEEVEHLGEKTANEYFCELLESLPKIKFNEIYEWFESVSILLDEPIEKSILRGIITYARRHNKHPSEIIGEMIRTQNVVIMD